MNYWKSLQLAIEMTLAAGRIGTPVFVRCTASVVESEESFISLMADMTELVSGWLGSFPCRLYALGGNTVGQVTATVEYPSGALALLCVARTCSRPRVDLVMLGSNGAVYHSQELFCFSMKPILEKALGTTEVITSALNRSLASGVPTDLASAE